ncbi:MAG: ABC transporter permease [Acidobacteriota bacterium]
MEELIRTVRLSSRSLRRNPALSAVSILALTLGIGLTTTMYSIVRGALRDLPFEEADRLMHLERNNPSEGIDSMEVTLHDFLDWREQQSSFEALAAFYSGTANLAGTEGRPERYDGAFITANAFELLGVQAALGRTLRPEEEGAGAAAVVVLGHEVWQNRFRGDPDVVGRSVRINGEPTTVIGVMPEGFRFPVLQDLWLPLRLDPATLERGEGETLEVFGRLGDDVTLERARTEMSAIAGRLAEVYPETNEGVGAVVKPYTLEFVGEEAVGLLYTFLVGVLGVLLIACANVANLLLARSALRSREVAVRSALGAGRLRVILGVLSEALVLAVAGAVFGLALAAAGTEIFDRVIQATDPPYWIHFGIDLRVGLFVAGLTAAATLLSGLLPALQASGSRAGEVLKDETRGASSFRLGRLARGLVVAEIAISCGLLVVTGLMVKSVIQLRTVDYGFPIDGVFTARIGLFESEYPTPEARVRFFEGLRERLEEQPGVEAAGLTTALPVGGTGRTRFALGGEAYADGEDLPLSRRVALTPGAFEAFRVGPLSGRSFDAHDRRDGRPVALVNRPFAERFFPGEDPVGRRIRLGDRPDGEEGEEAEPWRTIVGVVPDMVLGGPQDEDREGIYIPLSQSDDRFVSLAVRTRGEPMALTPAVREAVAAFDPDLPIYWVRPMTEVADQQMWFLDIFSTLFAVFGVSGLFLAVVGLYGVMAFSVQRRTHEVGIRMAMGAGARDILRLVLGQGAFQLGVGVVLGLGLALLLGRALRIMLFRVEPWDPWIFTTIVAVLLTAGLAAALLPARRAATIDPAVALRRE